MAQSTEFCQSFVNGITTVASDYRTFTPLDTLSSLSVNERSAMAQPTVRFVIGATDPITLGAFRFGLGL